MSLIANYINKLSQAWDEFWFSPRDLFTVSLFRMSFGFLLFLMYGTRLFDIKTFFYNDGMMPSSLVPSFLPEFMRPVFYIYFSSDTVNLLLHLIFVVLLLAFALGLLNRATTWVVFFLHLSFIQRNPSILYGADLITTFWLFYFCFINHSKYLNVFSMLRSKKLDVERSPVKDSDILSSVFIRLIQVQLGVMYAYTGMEKLKGQTWWDGSAVWYVMANENMVPFDLSFFSYIPWAVAIMTFSTLLFEIYFPFAMLFAPTKRIWLFLGFCLHFGAAFFMGLYYFSFVMLASYFVLIDSERVRRWYMFAVNRLNYKVSQ